MGSKIFAWFCCFYLINSVLYFTHSSGYIDLTILQRFWASQFYLTYDITFFGFAISFYMLLRAKNIRHIAKTLFVYQLFLVTYDIVLICVSKERFDTFCKSKTLGLLFSGICLTIVLWNTLKLKR
jgi:hypothetical protein